jgi:hypothetical protein
MDAKTGIRQLVNQTSLQINAIRARITTLENSATIEKKRALERYNDSVMSSENGGGGLCTDPNEFDPKDWTGCSDEDFEKIEEHLQQIEDALDQSVRTCVPCNLFFEPFWKLCPNCGKTPTMAPLRAYSTMICVRCERFGPQLYGRHMSSTAFCPYHGLKLKMQSQ